MRMIECPNWTLAGGLLLLAIFAGCQQLHESDVEGETSGDNKASSPRPTDTELSVADAKLEDGSVSAGSLEQLDAYLQELIDEEQIAGGVLMMAQHGNVIHLNALGMMDRQANKRMTTDAVFRIASMTKPVTSVAAMILCEQGLLELDDPVSKYIPELSDPQVQITEEPFKTEPAKRPITIRHLLTHTSGLTYCGNKGIGCPVWGVHLNLPGYRQGMKRLRRTFGGWPICRFYSILVTNSDMECRPTCLGGWWKSSPACHWTHTSAKQSSAHWA